MRRETLGEAQAREVLQPVRGVAGRGYASEIGVLQRGEVLAAVRGVARRGIRGGAC